MITESILNEIDSMNSSNIITGEEIADMVGVGDAYREGRKQIEHDEMVAENISKKFSNLMERLNNVPKKGTTLLD